MLQILYPKQNGPPNVAKSNFSGWQICTLMNLLTVLMGWSLDGKAAIHKTALQLAYQYAQNMYKLWMAFPPNSVMEITHSFARGPLKEITEVLSTSSGVHPCSSIQRQASSICTQNLPPASHSCPSWISTSQGDPSSSWPLPTPSTSTPLMTWPQPRTHHWRQLHLRWWRHSPRESWKSKKAMYSNPTRHWGYPSQITSIPGGKRLWWLLTSRLSCKNVFSWWTQRNSFNTISSKQLIAGLLNLASVSECLQNCKSPSSTRHCFTSVVSQTLYSKPHQPQ